MIQCFLLYLRTSLVHYSCTICFTATDIIYDPKYKIHFTTLNNEITLLILEKLKPRFTGRWVCLDCQASKKFLNFYIATKECTHLQLSSNRKFYDGVSQSKSSSLLVIVLFSHFLIRTTSLGPRYTVGQ